MKRWSLLAVAVLVVALVVWLSSTRNADDVVAPDATPEPAVRGAPTLITGVERSVVSNDGGPSAEGIVQVRVRAAGRPVARARVRLYAQNAGPASLVAAAATNDEGRVALDLGALRGWSHVRLSHTALVVYADAPDHYATSGPAIVRRLLDDHDRLRPPVVDVELTAGGVVRGRLIFEDGSPAAHGAVSLTTRTDATADFDGRFVVPRPRGRALFLVAGVPGCDTVQVQIPTSGDVGDVVVPRPPLMRGTVRFSDGSPVAHLTLQFARWRDPGPRGVRWSADEAFVVARTDAEGRIRAHVPDWRRHRGKTSDMMLEMGGGLDPEEDVQWAGFDADKRNQEIVIKHHRLIVQCRDTHGLPVPNLAVDVLASKGHNASTDLRTDEGGELSWFVAREPDQKAWITVRLPGAELKRTVHVPADTNTTIVRFDISSGLPD